MTRRYPRISRVESPRCAPSSNFPIIEEKEEREKKKNRKENETRMKGEEEEEELSSGRRSNEYGQLDESLESRSSFVLLHMC